MIKQITVPYTNPMKLIEGLHQNYGMSFVKNWGVYHAAIPSGLGQGWMTVFVKDDIHFIRAIMDYHEAIEFNSSDPVGQDNLIDIRIRTGGDHRSSFLSKENTYKWEMNQVNAVSAFIPKHYFNNVNIELLQERINKINYVPSVKDSIDSLLKFQYNNDYSAILLESELLKYNYNLLDYLNRPLQTNIFSERPRQIGQLKDILDEQFVAPPNLRCLSRMVGINTTDLQLLFKKVHGKTIKQYCIGLRMDKAIQLVLETNMPITRISLEVGYQNRSHFNQLYKNQIGLSPSSHRKQNLGGSFNA